MENLVSSFIGFILGIASTLIIEKLQVYRKVYNMVTLLTREIANNQSLIDLMRKVDFDKCAKDNFVFGSPSHNVYEFVKDDLTLFPPQVAINLVRYYEIIIAEKEAWEKHFKDKTYRDENLVFFLNTLENYTVFITLEYFKPIIDAKTRAMKYWKIRKFLNSISWEHVPLDWQRYKQLSKEIEQFEQGREKWAEVVERYTHEK